MENWMHYVPTEIVFGEGEFNNIGKYAERFNAKKILIVTGKGSMKRLGYTKKLAGLLGNKKAVLFEEVEPNPSCKTVDGGAMLARKEKCGLVIALGGGSAMDAAKAIAALAVNSGKAKDYLYCKKEFRERLPLIAIPSTSGTSSEMNKYAVLTDGKKGTKGVLRDFLLCPDIAIIDPELTATMPSKITASTGLDVLCHAIESYWSGKATPVSEMFALEAIRLVNENLAKACMNGKNRKARAGMSLATLCAGFAFSNTGTTDVHGLSYPLTTHFGVSHGFACAVFLPLFLEYNAPVIKEKAKKIAVALGAKNAKAGVKKLRALMGKVNAPTQLREFGVNETDLDLIVRQGLRKKNNPRKISAKKLRQMLGKIF